MYDVVLKEASAIILLHSEVKVSQLVWDRTYNYTHVVIKVKMGVQYRIW